MRKKIAKTKHREKYKGKKLKKENYKGEKLKKENYKDKYLKMKILSKKKKEISRKRLKIAARKNWETQIFRRIRKIFVAIFPGKFDNWTDDFVVLKFHSSEQLSGNLLSALNFFMWKLRLKYDNLLDLKTGERDNAFSIKREKRF